MTYYRDVTRKKMQLAVFHQKVTTALITITAGASILVIKDGKEELYSNLGYANRELKMPIRRDTIFRLFSMTKPITAVAVMKMMEQGKLDLAQPIEEILPGFKEARYVNCNETVYSNTPITVLHLLNMTSGLSYGDSQSVPGQHSITAPSISAESP